MLIAKNVFGTGHHFTKKTCSFLPKFQIILLQNYYTFIDFAKPIGDNIKSLDFQFNGQIKIMQSHFYIIHYNIKFNQLSSFLLISEY